MADLANKTLGVALQYNLDENTVQQTVRGSKVVEESLKAVEAEMRQIRMVSRELGQIGSAVGLLGAAISGPLLLAANNYIKTATQSTAVTNEWAAATAKQKTGLDEIGQAAAQAYLPVLEQSANFVKTVGDFASKNPEAVKAALDFGLVLTTVGVVGKLAAEGLRLYADFQLIAIKAQELITGQLMSKAATTNLEAAVLMDQAASESALARLGGSTASAVTGMGEEVGLARLGFAPAAEITAAGAGGIQGLLSTVLPVVVSAVALYLGSGIGSAVGNITSRGIYGDSYKAQTTGDAIATAFKGAELPGMAFELQLEKWGVLLPQTADALNKIRDSTNNWLFKLLGVTEQLDKVSTSGMQAVAGSPQEATVVKDYQTMQDQIAAAVESAAQQELSIKTDYAQKEIDLAQANAEALSNLAEQFSQSNAKALRNFKESEAQALVQFNQSEAKAIESSQQSLQKLAQAHRDRLLQLEQSHNDRLTKLAIDRDAVGIVQENQSYAEQKANENHQYSQQVADQRQALATQLRDLRQSYEEQRAQRQQQFTQQQADAAQQYQDQVKKQNQNYAKQQQVAQQQEEKQLKDLQAHLQAQEQQYHQAFIRQIYELNAALLGEQKMKDQGYQNALASAQAFINRYVGIVGLTGVTVTATSGRSTGVSGPGWNNGALQGPYYGHAGGGYASPEGLPEFVLKNSVTQSAERLIGGRLDQESVLALMMKGAAPSASLVYNDHRRLDGSISATERRAIAEDTARVLAGAFQQ